MIHLNELFKVSEDRFLLHKTSLDLMPGELLAIRCQEHQSTLWMDLLTGKTLPTGGDLLINNRVPQPSSPDLETAFVYRNEGFYERLKVSEYLKLFKDLKRSKMSIDESLVSCGLADVASKPIADLSYAQKKRLSLARVMLSQPKVLILQEPTLDLDVESATVIRSVIHNLRQRNTCIMVFCTLLEDALLLNGDVAIYADGQLRPIDTSENAETKGISPQTEDAESQVELHLDKIPAKLEDKIILLNPLEIHYVESIESQCWLSIGKEKYPCTFTLTELEKRLMPVGFFRCHRSYLVNLQQVREVITYSRSSYSLVLSDASKTEIPLSRGRLEELKAIFKL